MGYTITTPLQAIALVGKMPRLQVHVKVDEDAVEDIHQIVTGPLSSLPRGRWIGGVDAGSPDLPADRAAANGAGTYSAGLSLARAQV